MLLCNLKWVIKFDEVDELLRSMVKTRDHPSIESKTGCIPVTLLKDVRIVDAFWLPYRTCSNAVGVCGRNKLKGGRLL